MIEVKKQGGVRLESYIVDSNYRSAAVGVTALVDLIMDAVA